MVRTKPEDDYDRNLLHDVKEHGWLKWFIDFRWFFSMGPYPVSCQCRSIWNGQITIRANQLHRRRVGSCQPPEYSGSISNSH